MNSPRAIYRGPAHQRGAVMVLVTVAMLAILAMAALALDGGHMLLNKARLQNAVDAAALSGARTLLQVSGTGNAASLTRDAAVGTFTLNAQADGNDELATALAEGGAGFVQVELATSVYGPFSYPGPVAARYVRVSVANEPLQGFFWPILSLLADDTPDKAVSAIATAGPSPTTPCQVAPLMICGDPNGNDPTAGQFWGYRFGDLEVLKSGAGNTSPIGPGNFQLIRLGSNSGAADVRAALAGDIEQCNQVGETVETEPGNTVGPVAQGLNTRFGEYKGSLAGSAASYPPDQIISHSTPLIEWDEGAELATYDGQPVQARDGNLFTGQGALLDYNDWRRATAACPSGCTAGGVAERRVLRIVVGDCTGKQNGQTSVPVLGFGCFFLVQPLPAGGKDAQIFGQFLRECAGDNQPDIDPSDDSGPQIIQLYKTYIDNARTPSDDS